MGRICSVREKEDCVSGEVCDASFGEEEFNGWERKLSYCSRRESSLGD